MIILPITLTIAGAAAILHIWLMSRVVRARRPFKLSVGDGGQEPVLRRMRAHANFAENAPLFLILLALTELAGGHQWLLWGAGIGFILARIAHAFGMDRSALGRWRMVGMLLNTVAILALAVYAILIAYQSPPIRGGIPLPAGRTAALAI